MAKDEEEYFVIDGAYLKEQFRITMVRLFAPFRPAYWKAIGQAKGAKAKFETFLYWPEDAPTY